MVSHTRGHVLAKISAAIRDADRHMDQVILDALRGRKLRVEESTCNPDDLCYSVVQAAPLAGEAKGS
jgi:hypothetical protein